MKLYELLDLIDYNREGEHSKIQIVRFDADWDIYDECLTSSFVLVPLYEAEINELCAIDADVIRVDIDWKKLDEKMHIFDWGRK